MIQLCISHCLCQLLLLAQNLNLLKNTVGSPHIDSLIAVILDNSLFSLLLNYHMILLLFIVFFSFCVSSMLLQGPKQEFFINILLDGNNNCICGVKEPNETAWCVVVATYCCFLMLALLLGSGCNKNLLMKQALILFYIIGT